MNLSYFISKRISRQQSGSFSSTIHKIAVITITVGLGASIVSFLIMSGFERTIKNKIYNFSSHILIRHVKSSTPLEEPPFFFNNVDLLKHPEKYPMVTHVQEYAYKPGIIKTPDEMMGIAFKGVGKSFDVETFKENIVEGEFIHLRDSSFTPEVVLSKTIAEKVGVKVGDDVIVHFFQNPPRFRKLKVVGLYETNLIEYYDSKVIIGDMKLVQRLNNWADSVAGGLEVFIDFDRYDKSALYSSYMDERMDNIWSSDWSWFEKVSESYSAWAAYDFEEQALIQTAEYFDDETDYDQQAIPANQSFDQVFEWLHVVGRQVIILLGIILIVVCVNMISVVLILVMERTQMIGMLKALGARNRIVRSVFVYNGVNLVVRGLLFGNLLGVSVCFLQYKFRIIKLNAHDYYMAFVPIAWNVETILWLNVLILAVVTLIMLIPTAITAKINPIKAIRFD